MVTLAKRLYRAAVTFDHESRKVSALVGSVCPEPVKQWRVLDVGCGYGRYLRTLGGLGFDVIGVEENPIIVRANREVGLRCLTTEEFTQTQDAYDVIIMSHVIEHFAPRDLLPFIDRYLDRLKIGGRLVVATPLLTRFFYEDFDHIKPYHPTGLLMVFGEEHAQVQYYSRNKLRLENVWIRRGPWRFAHRRARYVRSPATRLLQLLELGGALAFRLSVGIVGQADGWVGMFRKVKASVSSSPKE